MTFDVSFRAKDFFQAMETARSYLSQPPEARHPPYEVGVSPHKHLLQVRYQDFTCLFPHHIMVA